MNLTTILIVFLLMALLGVFPAWPHSQSWGYAPSGLLGTVLVVILIVALMRRV